MTTQSHANMLTNIPVKVKYFWSYVRHNILGLTEGRTEKGKSRGHKNLKNIFLLILPEEGFLFMLLT